MQFLNIRIILVNTTHPGNIGAVARAMKNMCLEHLYLVKPKFFPHAEATARASGADDILATAHVCQTIDEAVMGCGLVLATSARRRNISWPELDPRDGAKLIATESHRHPTAIVFGREQAGLTNEELDRCHYLVPIPCNSEFSSLNLAAAVQIITYELYRVSLIIEKQQLATNAESKLATTENMELFYEHLERVLVETEFLDPKNPRYIMRRLRRLFNRTRPELVEMNILRGILTSIQTKIKR